MIVAADASFLVSLYGGDVNTPAARAWMASQAEPELFLRRHEDKLVSYPGAESYLLGQDVECVPLMLAVGMLREL